LHEWIFFCTFAAKLNKNRIYKMEERRNDDRKEPEIVYSKAVKAGKRIYYLDVKKARNEDLYLCITESKRKAGNEDEAPQFEKHKVFLYKEDFKHFTEGLEEVINFVKQQVGTIEDREDRAPKEEETPNASEDQHETNSGQEEKKRGFFGRLLN